jgi:hypothetical protein
MEPGRASREGTPRSVRVEPRAASSSQRIAAIGIGLAFGLLLAVLLGLFGR